MDIGALCLSHVMLVLAELIVCSRRGFACILAKWFWPTEMSIFLTHGSPGASCIKRVETYFGRRSDDLNQPRWSILNLCTGEEAGRTFFGDVHLYD